MSSLQCLWLFPQLIQFHVKNFASAEYSKCIVLGFTTSALIMHNDLFSVRVILNFNEDDDDNSSGYLFMQKQKADLNI